MENKTKSRKWLLTINNPIDKGFSHDYIKGQIDKLKNVDYWCLCDEVGDNKTPHTHIFIYRQNAMLFSTVKKLFSSAHIDYCKGTCQENRDYIRKQGKYKNSHKAETNLENTFEECGDVPLERQGQRNDLIDLYDMIKSGMTNYEILESNPEYMMNIEKIERCRQIVKEEQFKNSFRMLSVGYFFGKTGIGKTRKIMELYGYVNVYRVTDYKNPFDNYKGQDVILFDEFRSSLPITNMLNYLDGYPLDLPCRYLNKIACFTKVFIVSNIGLEEQYKNVQKEENETWQAFLRRIHTVKQYTDDEINEWNSAQEYINYINGKWEQTKIDWGDIK